MPLYLRHVFQIRSQHFTVFGDVQVIVGGWQRQTSLIDLESVNRFVQ